MSVEEPQTAETVVEEVVEKKNKGPKTAQKAVEKVLEAPKDNHQGLGALHDLVLKQANIVAVPTEQKPQQREQQRPQVAPQAPAPAETATIVALPTPAPTAPVQREQPSLQPRIIALERAVSDHDNAIAQLANEKPPVVDVKPLASRIAELERKTATPWMKQSLVGPIEKGDAVVAGLGSLSFGGGTFAVLKVTGNEKIWGKTAAGAALGLFAAPLARRIGRWLA